jgi:hypothetical protein
LRSAGKPEFAAQRGRISHGPTASVFLERGKHHRYQSASDIVLTVSISPFAMPSGPHKWTDAKAPHSTRSRVGAC